MSNEMSSVIAEQTGKDEVINLMANLTANRIADAINGISNVVDGLEKNVKTKRAAAQITSHLKYAVALIGDFQKAIEQQVRELARLHTLIADDADKLQVAEKELSDARLELEAVTAVKDDLAKEVSDIRGLVVQREEELAGTRTELNTVLRQRDEEATKKIELPILSAQQPAASTGFWVINREWHDWFIAEHMLTLRGSMLDRASYEQALRVEVCKLAGNNGLNTDIREIHTKVVIVDWDGFFATEGDGPSRFGPVFSAGTLKLLPVEVAQPEEPKVPLLLAENQPQLGRKVWALNQQYFNWYVGKFPSHANMNDINNRNQFRTTLATHMNEKLGLLAGAKLPILIIDWDMSPAGTLFFVTPEIDLTPFVTKPKPYAY